MARRIGIGYFHGKVYKYGLLDLKERIRKELDGLDFMNDPEATDKPFPSKAVCPGARCSINSVNIPTS